MRTNFIMKFYCAECGRQLNLVGPADRRQKPAVIDAGEKIPPEPTGAECSYNPPVFVEPCRFCIQKKTAPAEKLFEAIQEMTKAGGIG